MKAGRRCRSAALLVTAHLFLPSSIGFSVRDAPRPPASQRTISRSDFFQHVALTAVGLVASVVAPSPAAAAGDVSIQVAAGAALRTLRSCQGRFAALEAELLLAPTADGPDYAVIRRALRAAPLSELRKSMSGLVRAAGEEGPAAEALAAQYRTFIASLEAMDAKAGLGEQGRAIPLEDMGASYGAARANLDEFVRLAESAAGAPLTEAATTTSSS